MQYFTILNKSPGTLEHSFQTPLLAAGCQKMPLALTSINVTFTAIMENKLPQLSFITNHD